ncbi:MAG: AsnC family protein [Bdellovibrionaceae bacterium]|nr:AsnC family protein [Pseudobdellovibrionaceae bacterium]NUM58143.1 AsnC family protein [Pseudobdellovibrionaceae bacterium]
MDESHKTSQFDEKDQKILDISVNNPHITDSEIAQKVGLTRESVVRRRKREGYQFLLKDSAKSTKLKLEEIATKAVAELDVLVCDPDPKVRIAAIALALKYLPESSRSSFNKESLKDLIKHPEFMDEVVKTPGVGHAIFMKIISHTSKSSR